MSDKLEVIITGKNGVSRIFQEVSSDATKMGTGVEASSKKASKSLDDLKKNAVAVGAGFGAALGVAAVLGQAYYRQEQEIEGLRRAYGDAADEIISFTEELQNSTVASNDQAREAALIASTLARNYAFTADEIKQVLEVSADLAAVTGLSLEDASQRVSAALRGEAEGAEVLGLTLNQAAIDRENLTLTMSNEEAAHFRLNALLEQAAFAEGAAADKAATHAGRAQQLVNQLQDVAQSAGGALGPLGQYASVLGNLAYITPAAGAGIGKLVTSIGAAGGLAATLGPAGLAAAALAAGAGILYLATRTEDYVSAAEQAAIATDNLDTFFMSLARTLDPFRQNVILDLSKEIDQMIADAAQREEDLYRIRELRLASPQGVDLGVPEIVEATSAYFGLTEAQLQYLDSNHDLMLSVDELDAAIASYSANLDRLNPDQIREVQTGLTQIFSRKDLNFLDAARAIQGWVEELDAGTISGEQFIEKINQAATDMKAFTTVIGEAEQSALKFEYSMRAVSDAMTRQSDELGRLLEPQKFVKAAAFADFMRAISDEFNLQGEAAEKAIIPTRDLGDTLATQTQRVEEARFASVEYLQVLDAEAQKADEAAAAIADYARALGQVPAMTDSGAEQFAAGVKRSGTALGDAFRVAVGNTDAIGNQSQQVADWAKELINVRGEHGKIDDLLAKGLITQEQYNKAQSAGTKIFDANAKIQEDILAIQAKQAPWLGQLAKEQQHYMDESARLPENQQALRLAYMDSEESAKALAAANLAAAAANGELGKAGEATATKMITAAAEADPYLRKLLQDMGVISVGADGTISVNFDDVVNAGASLDDVVKVLEDLRDIIAEAFNITLTSNADDQLASLTGIVSLLNNLQDRETTYYVNEVRSGISIGSPSGPSISAQAHGGVIPAAHGYAGGGDILVGEFGPELIRRGGGGIVLPTGATRAQMASNGLGGLSLTININGDVMDPGKLTETITRELVPAIQLATQQFYDGQGLR